MFRTLGHSWTVTQLSSHLCSRRGAFRVEDG